MNKAKLSALCAKARGISPSEMAAICYDPLDDANQADALLEYVARKLNCSWSLIYLAHFGRYDCWLHRSDCVPDTSAETQNLAKILCSLKASPEVTAEELADAVEGE